jgi:hypothetical protein
MEGLLAGARDGAIASIKAKQRKVEQDARQVKTKFRKTFATYFFPVGDDNPANRDRLGPLFAAFGPR